MKILCADAIASELLQPLRDAGHEVLVEPELDGTSLPDRLTDDSVEVLVVRSTKVSKEALEASPALSMVVRAGAGTDNIDKDVASALGIYVSNVPGQNAVAVAELAMGLLLAIDRQIPAGMADLRSGKWNKGEYSKADGILGKQIAIIGLGEIGYAVAHRARSFGMPVTALRKPDRSEDAQSRIRAAGIRLIDTMEELLGSADVVSLHVPGTPGTKGMVDAGFLSMMKDGAILLNTARGDVLDAEALVTAMEEKNIHAGLDVWPSEPAGKSGEWASVLSQHPNVVGSHHIGASTAQAQSAVAAGTVAVVEAYLDGRVINCVNMVDERLGEVVLTVRHLDKVGVLAKIFATIRKDGANVYQMENQVFVGKIAAVASINLDHEPSVETLRAIEGDDDVLGVSIAVNRVS